MNLGEFLRQRIEHNESVLLAMLSAEDDIRNDPLHWVGRVIAQREQVRILCEKQTAYLRGKTVRMCDGEYNYAVTRQVLPDGTQEEDSTIRTKMSSEDSIFQRNMEAVRGMAATEPQGGAE